MAFEATKREWSELYTFFHLLSDGFLHTGTPEATINEKEGIPICSILREENDEPILYRISKTDVIINAQPDDIKIPRTALAEAAKLILNAIKTSAEDLVVSPDGIEEFLDQLNIYSIEAKTAERTNLTLFLWNMDMPPVGVILRSRLSKMLPLLDGGRAANLKFELTGMKFANPMISKVNAVEGPNPVTERMLLIDRLGGILKYADVADKVFRSNLSMFDLHFPRLLAEMLRTMHLDGLTRITDLTAAMKELNPLKIKDELINKHHYYEYKMKQFLAAAATGMRPAKIYNGAPSAIEGLILLNGDGTPLYYPAAKKAVFEEFLFLNTRFERGDLIKDHYGTLEKENGVLYFRLNAKVGLIKR